MDNEHSSFAESASAESLMRTCQLLQARVSELEEREKHSSITGSLLEYDKLKSSSKSKSLAAKVKLLEAEVQILEWRNKNLEHTLKRTQSGFEAYRNRRAEKDEQRWEKIAPQLLRLCQEIRQNPASGDCLEEHVDELRPLFIGKEEGNSRNSDVHFDLDVEAVVVPVQTSSIVFATKGIAACQAKKGQSVSKMLRKMKKDAKKSGRVSKRKSTRKVLHDIEHRLTGLEL